MKCLTKENIRALVLIKEAGYSCSNVKVACRTHYRDYALCPFEGMCDSAQLEAKVESCLKHVRLNPEVYMEELL